MLKGEGAAATTAPKCTKDTETARAVKKTSRRALSYLLALTWGVPASSSALALLRRCAMLAFGPLAQSYVLSARPALVSARTSSPVMMPDSTLLPT